MVAFGSCVIAMLAWSSGGSARHLVAPVVPYPKSVLYDSGSLSLDHPIVVAAGKEALQAANLLIEEIATVANVKAVRRSKSIVGSIVLRIGGKGGPESYTLKVTDRITIESPTRQGLSYGIATLLQAIRLENGHPSIFRMSISDEPDRPFRGLMVDVARRYHSEKVLEQCVLLCHLYKLNYLQPHLSDDQAFTFPSKAFPLINTQNQHGGPTYTVSELKRLVAFANARGVTIIPEMDMPGHSATLIRTMPDVFKIRGTKPYEHHASINFVKPEVLRAIDTLVGEMLDVFWTSPYFHMGGDEADLALADQNSDFQAAFKKLGLPPHSQQELFRRFIGQVDEMVKKRGKKLIVWEGFGRDPQSRFPISKDITVMEFENAYYMPEDLLKDGYEVINASWTPLYVVNRHVWSADKIYAWDPSRFGRFSNLYPTTEWFTVPNVHHVIGVEACSWEGPEQIAIENLRKLVPAMAERVWGFNGQISYPGFAYRLTRTDQVFDDLVHPINLASSKPDAIDPSGFDVPCFTKPLTVSLKSKVRGAIRFTLDGSIPTANSKTYTKPITLAGSTTIRSAVFDFAGEQTGYETSKPFYYVPPHLPNLATHKKVTVSGGTQGGQIPDLAVDDNLDLASSWWAGPAPQWLQVDLANQYAVNRIEVFLYWDGHRYYQYMVEGSNNGKKWEMLADRSQNTTPSSSQGDEIRFPAKVMRYVRVNMLKGSANEGVHLVELRVWEAK